jgi:2-keto-4-pentenoate hydratase/2-oxohepta-3-ene-1,7-dioic acid hydratase in catechol pathway
LFLFFYSVPSLQVPPEYPRSASDVLSTVTTIPAFTAVMTGTPAGVDALMKSKKFLNNGDVVEVSTPGNGELRNKIVFE